MAIRLHHVAALAALVLLAGCAGLVGGPGAADGPTTESVPLSEASYPAGTNESGVTNVTALRAANAEAVANTSYEFHYSRVVDVESDYANVTAVQRSDPDDRRAHYRSTIVEGRGDNSLRKTVQRYITGSQYYDNVTSAGRTAFQTGTVTSFDATHTRLDRTVVDTLYLADLTVDGAYAAGNHTYVRYDVVGYNLTSDEFNVTGAEGSVLLREDGLVADFEIGIDTDAGTLSLSARYDDLGEVSVSRPEWVDDAAASNSSAALAPAPFRGVG